jgi:L-ascorbate metabolism protein UlaG (beta-lactamase superfamily)
MSSSAEDQAAVSIRRLGWAGAEIEYGGVKLGIDVLEDLSPMAPFIGEPQTGLPPAEGPLAAALLTHLHGDHTDPAAISRALATDGRVLRPRRAEGTGLEAIATLPAEEGLAGLEADREELGEWQSVEIGPFTVTAVPAVDGFGDPQVSWLIQAGGRTVFHGGDTIFHGSWWLIAMRLGPVDVALLPCNGPLCDFPHRQPPSPFAAAMDPRQAAVAAKLLGARTAVPIHYDTIHAPPTYAQVDDPAGAFSAAAAEVGVEARVLDPGATLEI